MLDAGQTGLGNLGCLHAVPRLVSLHGFTSVYEVKKIQTEGQKGRNMKVRGIVVLT